MPLPLLADPAVLARWAGRDAADPAVTDALASASARFRGAVRHSVSRVADDEIWLDGYGATVLFLPAAPVLAVTTVEVHGRPATDFTWSRLGVLHSRTCWPDELDAVRVVYTHGHDPIPDEVADAVLTEARYLLTVQPGVSAMTVGGESVSYTTPDAEMPQTWKTAVEAHRLNRGDQT
ncbi:mobile element protein [Amycolatopsis sp. CA-126428]|uniref:mobile element protein n=1 Tax=Amycolatopsis sp. CA-126428 TaxID=2073158 RepID=UPI000CD1DE76|nr:mobile element protein [Amycolatopsis sp. CA-126428]